MRKIKNLALKLDGNSQIISVLNKNVEIVKKSSRFEIAVEHLNSNQKKLMDLQVLLDKDITNIAKANNNHRKKLEESIISVIKIMQAFAFDKKKKDLQQRLKYLTSEYVQNCLDIELIKNSKKIWLIANKHGGHSLTFVDKVKSSLNRDKAKVAAKFEMEYGLNSAMIKNIEDSTIRFIESMHLYQDEMSEKEKAAGEIKKISKQTKKLLADKIDRFVNLFESKNPGFYNDYRQLRDKQLEKQKKEKENQETDAQNVAAEKSPVKQAEPEESLKTP